MKPITFFTLRDLNVSGGGAIRINSLIDVLSKYREVEVFSNTTNFSMPNVKHHYVGVVFSANEKRVLQASLTFSPILATSILFKNKLKRIESIFKNLVDDESDIVFCEYLDTSLGYYLLKKKLISRYINDIHGVATLELKYKQFSNRLLKKGVIYIARQHDKEVLSRADAHLFVSTAMKDYFHNNYTSFQNKKYFIIPNAANKDNLESTIDSNYLDRVIKENNIRINNPIIFFAGGYKELGGIHDLILVFSRITKHIEGVQLVLVGGGFNQNSVDSLISKLNLKDDIIQIGMHPYNKLFSLQQMADVIVCPEKDNEYSNLVVHLKYFDSVTSNRPVVCAGFDAVKEINQIGNFAKLYEPSDLKAMESMITYVLKHNDSILKLSQSNRDIASKKLTYDNFKDEIIKISV